MEFHNQLFICSLFNDIVGRGVACAGGAACAACVGMDSGDLAEEWLNEVISPQKRLERKRRRKPFSQPVCLRLTGVY